MQTILFIAAVTYPVCYTIMAILYITPKTRQQLRGMDLISAYTLMITILMPILVVTSIILIVVTDRAIAAMGLKSTNNS